MWNSQFLRFCFWGSVNTLIGLAIILTVQAVTHQSYLANAAGFALGGFWGYRIHARQTFRSKQTSKGLGMYFAVLLSGYGLNLIVLHSLLEAGDAVLSQVGALAVYTVYSYAMNKGVVFSRSHGRP